jgi:hypothetical protein
VYRIADIPGGREGGWIATSRAALSLSDSAQHGHDHSSPNSLYHSLGILVLTSPWQNDAISFLAARVGVGHLLCQHCL